MVIRHFNSIWAAIFTVFCLLWATPVMALSQLQASVDKNPVLINESFVLQIVADDDVDANAIDTSILLKQFVVGQTQVSRATQSINSKTRRSTTWSTVLLARKAGTYQIPAFQVKGISSNPIQLTVSEEASGSSEERDIYLKSSLHPDVIYPGQSSVLETKLYLAVQMERGSLSDPESDQASFTPMDDDTDRVEVVNGRRYRVITRRHAISAEQAGTWTIRPPLFSGSLITAQARSFFDHARTKPVQVVGDDLTLRVEPIPANAPKPFIPAEYLTLQEETDTLPTQITVGEPMTRKIILSATGIPDSMLPALTHSYPDAVNVYPDKVESSTHYSGNTVTSLRTESAALIATQPGTLTLPEIRIAYWDTRYHQMAEVSLPARSIEVLAAPSTPTDPEPQVFIPQSPETLTPLPWHWLSMGLATLWLLTLLSWWLHVRFINRSSMPLTQAIQPTQPKYAKTEAWQVLQQAIHQQTDVSKPLTLWLQQDRGIHSLADLGADATSMALKQAYQTYQASRFSAHAHPVAGEQLVQALEQFRQNARPTSSNNKTSFRLYP